MSKIVFGPQLPTAGRFASINAIATAATQAESLGFKAVFMRDHIERDMEQHLNHTTTGFCEEGLDPGDPNIYETLITMSYLSAVTREVKLGVMILLLPQRNPILAAKQIATIDAMSNGRVIVGVGVGNVDHKKEMEILGVDYRIRGAMVDEYIRVMKEIWTKPVASFKGRFVNFSDAYIYPKPVQKPHPPIFIGGGYHLQPRILRRVAELGDGWVPIAPPGHYKEGSAAISKMAEEYGRKDNDFKYMAYLFTSIAPTREEAENRYEALLKSQSVFHKRQDSAQIHEDDFRYRSLIGAPDDIIKRIQEYVDAGVTHFELLFGTSTLEEYLQRIKLFAKEVIPSF
ncbi:MAG: TIGR03619 family F420-dependent LLM class oxidoreductase [Thaumarchaeota archaeon]|nr:TIGR03619 family F420-dependent LLM class oxidoreductase [Nitrososphaerota archaeon]